MPQSEQREATPQRPVNSTAYKIFKLLQWLIETSHSVDALNRRFQADPAVGRALSSDSIWLYINTLKALGCQIRRPSPKNNFRYELLHHPFGLMLSSAQLEALFQVKAHAQHGFNHQEMLVLDRFLKKIVTYSACENSQEVIEHLFDKSRSYDYSAASQHIADLEQWIEADQLLSVDYHSPLNGARTFHFLPEALFYKQGVVYVRGERPEFNEPSNLRVDRLLQLSPVANAQLAETLQNRRVQKTEIWLEVLVDRPNLFDGFGLRETEGVYAQNLTWFRETREQDNTQQHKQRPEHYQGYQVRLLVREWFYLKQRLLACGFPFKVLSPTPFREDLQKTLSTMKQYYQPDTPDKIETGYRDADNEVPHGCIEPFLS